MISQSSLALLCLHLWNQIFFPQGNIITKLQQQQAMDSKLTCEEVLKRDIPWETYMTTKLINNTGLQLLRHYDHRPDNVRAALLEENGVAYVRMFVGILRDISKQETVEYMLTMVDEMLTANPKRARLFHDKSFQNNEDVYRPFLSSDVQTIGIQLQRNKTDLFNNNEDKRISLAIYFHKAKKLEATDKYEPL